MKKLALVSLGLPPSQSGQSIVLYHLLKEIPPENYCLITLRNFHLYRYLKSSSTKLSGRYYFLHPDYQIVRLLVKTASLLSIRPLLCLATKIRVRQIKKILVEERVQVVIACTGDLFDPPAAFMASRELGIPFILYAFDYYSRQWTGSVTRSFAEKLEREILQGAIHVIVPNECMAKEYAERYCIRPTIIHNPFDLMEYERNAAAQQGKKTSDEVSIVYTGSVYDAHYTAFQNLIAAIPKTGIPDLILHIYTPQSLAQLVAHGMTGPVKIHRPQPNNEMPGIQRSADILFLPLAFRSTYPKIIKTSAPGKIGEYLAAKKPVLVHAPKDSFIAWYFRKYGCGEVVFEDNVEKLADAIVRLLQDKRQTQELVANAYERAKSDFDLENASKKFLAAIDELQTENRAG
jgi:glycosyltransferase involved in cell wall biosynthesis